MDFKLTQKELDEFKQDEAVNPVIKYLKNKESVKFNIGDVLIRQVARYDYAGPHGRTLKWTTDNVSNVSNAPKKFVYVFENEFGIGYIKQLRANGQGFTNYMVCTANIDFDHTRFTLDPDYADHLLLAGKDDKFAYNERFKHDKAAREEVYKHNKALIDKTDTIEQVNALFDRVKAGDSIWIGRSMYQAADNKFTVVEVKNESNYRGKFRNLYLTNQHGQKISYSDERLQSFVVFTSPPRPFERNK
jgi:hypothetical protein